MYSFQKVGIKLAESIISNAIKFSLLICVYAKENPQHFTACIHSILTQTVLPDELIIVKDGPLTEALDNVIATQITRFPNEITIISLPQNVSQGIARAEGIKKARHEWIALMDSDDVCRPERFEKQLKQIAENPCLDLIGGQITEFDDTTKNTAQRIVPITHGKILLRTKQRNPFNTMTVMLKRTKAVNAGNFRYFIGFEDYDLYARMIANGAVCANHPDTLVDVRVGNGMYARRKGLTYIRSEWRMQCQLYKLELTNLFDFLKNILLRIPIRLLPSSCLGLIYKNFARSKDK